MSQPDLYEYLRLLSEKPKWFFQNEDIALKLECLEAIQQLGTPSTIYYLIPLLRSNNLLIRSKTAETIIFLFRKLGSLNAYNDSLRLLPVELSDIDLFCKDFEDETGTQLLSIASLNHNGYVREKAVKVLGTLKQNEGLKFILLRLGDWVPAVRNAATIALAGYMEPQYMDLLLQELPTIDWLLKVQRVDLSDIHQRINTFILEGAEKSEFYNRINKLSESSRYRFYKLLIANRPLTPEQIDRLSHDRNSLVRIAVLKMLTGFDRAIQEKLIALFLRDRSARIRLEALYASKKFDPMFIPIIRTLVSDENASVRELSRRLLKMEGTEAAVLYRQRITAQEMLAGSLAGLAETGAPEDLPLFESSIKSGNRLMVLASLSAIHRLDGERAKQLALDLLGHSFRRVRGSAKAILARQCDRETLQCIRDRYAAGDPALRRTILPLYQQIGGWRVAADFLLALTVLS